VLLSAIVDLDLMIEFLDLLFMLLLASLKLLDVRQVDLLALLVHRILPDAESFIGYQLIHALNRTKQESLGLFLGLNVGFPSVPANVDCLLISNTSKPVYFIGNVLQSLGLLNLILIFIKSVSESSSLNSLRRFPDGIF
jgi:hypothetical protein